MKKTELVATAVTLAGCLFAWRMGMPTDTLLLSTGWLFIASLVAFLAIYRVSLAVHEHYRLKVGTHAMDSRMSARIESLDRFGIFLTVAAILYTIVFVFVLAELVLNSAIDSIARLFEIL